MVESTFGLKILQQCGWKEGEGLGRNKHGMKECIQITKRYDEAEGLGKKARKMNDTWWENNYNDVLKNMQIGKSNERITRSRSRSMSMTESRKESQGKGRKKYDSDESEEKKEKAVKKQRKNSRKYSHVSSGNKEDSKKKGRKGSVHHVNG
eukprot:CAMPEP_0170513656 /NCGR_PEP_ID=MMETSP0209-20121228/181_1 /TAXON_ID=665100 ORGANISM="Litonotus pictus, Strain P1" /NCGR_SAMPLE_ID=MMETSP0209 /ASSEMBLY_ACC=CAM_ASM_000301 /LENGTH=150 /DNA_ID=CAMNT_0010797423 /DNA_START=91 /DNA_END=540 /DNA_ORIENTATION=-